MIDFAPLSLFAVYSAMAVYTVAFLFFTWDLAKRSASTPALVMANGEASPPSPSSANSAPTATGYQRIGISLMALGFAFHCVRHSVQGACGKPGSVGQHV